MDGAAMLVPFVAATLISVLYPASRHFVYTFDIDTAARTSDGSKSDAGTIDADVLGFQTDTGTVVRISEQSKARPDPKPAMCVTYGTGLVQCDVIQNVTVEEMCLLRVLGRNFVNWSEVDRQRAWHNGAFDGHARESNDFQITGQTNGLFDIAFKRVLNVPGFDGYVSTTNGRVSYDRDNSTPMSLTQETVTQPQTGQTDRIIEDLTLRLQSASLVARPG
jgi:hypothetical protein